MRNGRTLMPSPAMVVAIAALVAALAGSAYAGHKLGLGALNKSAKQQTVGVGKLTYASTTTSVPASAVDTLNITATCPAGLRPIGGGVKTDTDDDDFYANDSHLTVTGWAAEMFNNTGVARTATVTVACAASQKVTGAPPAS